MVAGKRKLVFAVVRLRLTVVVRLLRVRHQPAVVRSWRLDIGDAVAVVVVVALVPQAVLVRVQLGAVDHQGTVVLGVLVTVAIAAGRQRQ